MRQCGNGKGREPLLDRRHGLLIEFNVEGQLRTLDQDAAVPHNVNLCKNALIGRYERMLAALAFAQHRDRGRVEGDDTFPAVLTVRMDAAADLTHLLMTGK